MNGMKGRGGAAGRTCPTMAVQRALQHCPCGVQAGAAQLCASGAARQPLPSHQPQPAAAPQAEQLAMKPQRGGGGEQVSQAYACSSGAVSTSVPLRLAFTTASS